MSDGVYGDSGESSVFELDSTELIDIDDADYSEVLVVECTKLVESVENILNSNADIQSRFLSKGRRWMLQGENPLHCPFYWQGDLSIQTYGDHEIDCLSEFEEMFEETSFTFRSFHRFVTHLIMCYHNFYKRLVEDSLKNMSEMERMLCRPTKEESNDPLFSSIKDALLHVLYSCRFYLLEATNQDEEAHQIFEKIKLFRDMDEANKAAIWGIRAAVYVEYGYLGIKSAIEYISTAISLDKENAFWPFFKGLYLGRLRRMENGSILLAEKEIVFLEAATKKLENSIFYSFTAETYLDIVELTEKKPKVNQLSPKEISSGKQLSQMLDKFTKTAVKYFEKSVKMEANNAHLLFRYGQGLLRLRYPYQDLGKAEELLQKGLKISPMSGYGNYVMALFIMNYTKDTETAELYLKKSADRNNFRAHIELCRKRLLEDQSSVVPELEKLLNVYQEIIPKVCKLYGELICCHLFVRYDLVKACNYARNLIDLQSPWINYIYKFNSEVFPLSRTVPLIELLITEIRNKLYHEKTTEVQRNSFKTFIHYILQVGIQTKAKTPADILQRYLKEVEERLQKQRQFLVTKADVQKECISTKDSQPDRYLRNSKKSEYHKYYVGQKDRSLCDIVQPDLLHESNRKKNGGESENIIQKYEHDLPRRCHSRSPSESSTNAGEALQCLTKGLESLVINKVTRTHCQKKPDTLHEGYSSNSSSDKIFSEASLSKEELVDLEKKRIRRSRREHYSPIMNTDCNSSSDRKLSQSNQGRKIRVNPSPYRKSKHVNRGGHDELPYSCELSSPYSSSERKSSRSHCEDYRSRNRSSDDSSSSSSRSSKSGESKFSRKSRGGSSHRRRYNTRRESFGSDGLTNRHGHKRRNDRHRERSHRERSYSSDRSKHYRRHHNRNDHKRNRSRRRDHSHDQLRQKTYSCQREDRSDRDTS